MESFLTSLKKDVHCSLCNDTLIEPKILPCFHTFCKLCIKRHAELIEEVNVFKCPECKTEINLPEISSVEDLKPSLAHSRILKGLNLVEEGAKVCSVSGSHSPASWYCFDCDHSLCQECEKSHSFFMKDHKVVGLSDLKKEDIELIMTRENHCKSHSNQRLALFCEDCDTMICMTCWQHDHTDHKFLKLDKFASTKREVLSKHLEVLNKLKKDQKRKNEQEQIATTAKQDGERAKREVKETTKKIIETAKEKERELLRQIEEKMNTATRNLNIIHHLPAVEEHIKNVMERGLASEMVNIREKECSEDFSFNPIQPFSRILFIPNQELMQQVNSGLGGIASCFDLEALRQENLTFMTETATGDLGVNPDDVVDVQISPKDDVKDVKYTRTDGKIEVEFIAKVAGPLTAEVQVNGNHVSNSPLIMNVKPQQIRIAKKFNMKGLNTLPKKATGIAVNKENSRIAVADQSHDCVHVFNTDGNLLLTYGSQGSDQGQLNGPRGLAFVNDTNIVIADCDNHRICIVDTTTGVLVKTFGKKGNGNGEFSSPNGVHVDDDGNIIVCDFSNHRVQVFTRDGDYQYQFGLTARDNFGPVSIVTHGGRYYVSDDNNHVIHVFEKKDGVPTRISTIGSKGSDDGQLKRPWGLAIDNDHHLLVCEHLNDRIQKFTLDGRLVGKTCDQISRPIYITVLDNGQLLITSYSTGAVFFSK